MSLHLFPGSSRKGSLAHFLMSTCAKAGVFPRYLGCVHVGSDGWASTTDGAALFRVCIDGADIPEGVYRPDVGKRGLYLESTEDIEFPDVAKLKDKEYLKLPHIPFFTSCTEVAMRIFVGHNEALGRHSISSEIPVLSEKYLKRILSLNGATWEVSTQKTEPGQFGATLFKSDIAEALVMPILAIRNEEVR